ncbi:hypothetical protein NPIL_522481, partial [Nephila pilipes]
TDQPPIFLQMIKPQTRLTYLPSVFFASMTPPESGPYGGTPGNLSAMLRYTHFREY